MGKYFLLAFFVLVLVVVQVHAIGLGEISDMGGLNVSTGSVQEVQVFVKNDGVGGKTVQFFANADKTGLLVNGVAQFQQSITLMPYEQVNVTLDLKPLHADQYVVSWGYKQTGNFMGNRIQKQFGVSSFGADVQGSAGSGSSGGSSGSLGSSGSGGGDGGNFAGFYPYVSSMKSNATNTTVAPGSVAQASVQDVAPNEGAVGTMQVGDHTSVAQGSVATIVAGGQKAVQVIEFWGFKLLPQTARQKLLGELAIIFGVFALGTQLLLSKGLRAEVAA